MNRLAKRLAGAPILAVVVLAALGSDAAAQELPERAAGMDANKNGVIDRDEMNAGVDGQYVVRYINQMFRGAVIRMQASIVNLI